MKLSDTMFAASIAPLSGCWRTLLYMWADEVDCMEIELEELRGQIAAASVDTALPKPEGAKEPRP